MGTKLAVRMHPKLEHPGKIYPMPKRALVVVRGNLELVTGMIMLDVLGVAPFVSRFVLELLRCAKPNVYVLRIIPIDPREEDGDLPLEGVCKKPDLRFALKPVSGHEVPKFEFWAKEGEVAARRIQMQLAFVLSHGLVRPTVDHFDCCLAPFFYALVKKQDGHAPSVQYIEDYAANWESDTYLRMPDEDAVGG